MSRLWVFDIDSDFAAGYGLVYLCGRERNRYEICSSWTWARDWQYGKYRINRSPAALSANATSSNIYQLQNTKFTLHLLRHARVFMHRHACNDGITVPLMCIWASWYFFCIEQGTMDQLLRGKVCLISRKDFYTHFNIHS